MPRLVETVRQHQHTRTPAYLSRGQQHSHNYQTHGLKASVPQSLYMLQEPRLLQSTHY